MNWLIVLFLVIALAVLLLRVRPARPQCQSLSCEVETKRPVPVMMPYSWETPVVVNDYSYGP